MVQKIVIEGDLVRAYEESPLYTARLEDLIPQLEHRPPVTLFHPRSAIFTHWDESNPQEKHVRFLCELPPAIRSIVKSGRRYRLAMPWTYFIYSFITAGEVTRGNNWLMRDHKVFHTNARITRPTDRLWTAFLPNVYEDGNICFGSTGAPTAQPLADRVDQLVNEWYLTEFNNDVIGGRANPMPYNLPRDRDRVTAGLRAWIEATRTDGATAWTNFPAWQFTANEHGYTSYTVQQALGLDQRVGRLDMIEQIPEITPTPSFGAAEEWLRQLTPLQRGRLQVALANVTDDDPNNVTLPEPEVTDNPEDDGGEPI